jgi:hypothetical protein
MALAPGFKYEPGSHSRTVVTPDGERISRRQAENIASQLAGHSSLSAQRRAGGLRSGISDEERENRNSWRKNAEAQGLDARIKGNADYKLFNQELKQVDKSQQHLIKSLGKQAGGEEYKKQRLDVYLKFGLITKTQYNAYRGV